LRDQLGLPPDRSTCGRAPVVTSRDVAISAGVSQATVSRVMAGSSLVTESTRQRVLTAAQRTGYQTNHAARAMRTQRSGTIGIVVADLLNPFYPEVIAASSRELSRRDLRMILWSSEFEGEVGAAEAIGQRQIDGLIFTTALPSSGQLEGALQARAPVVLLNRTIAGLACDQVESDNYRMSFAMAEYFAGAGHTQVGLLTADRRASTAALREKGFREGVAATGMSLTDDRIADGLFSHRGGHAAFTAIMSSAQPPTALFCVNDFAALGALDAARAQRVAVPDDLWIAGYDDIDMASWEAFDLTTAKQPVDAMVSLAVDLLLERINDPSLPFRHYKFPGSLSIRGSTAHAPFAAIRGVTTEPILITSG